MELIWQGIQQAFWLLLQGDLEVLQITLLSLQVSGLATLLSLILGVPLGTIIGLTRFPGRSVIVSLVNTGMGLPPVVVGLYVSIILWRSGPLGVLELLYTPTAIVIAQCIIAFPVVTGLTMAGMQQIDPQFRLQLLGLGASHIQLLFLLLREVRLALLAAIMAGFGAVISEIGASMMVGGNIFGHTRVLTTATVLETSKGNFEVAIALSMILNVALGLKLRRAPSSAIARQVERWLDRLGIAHLKDRPARELSGGEAQRTSLARAFVLEPEVLLLDEPFAALDPPARETLLMELQEILPEAQTTTIFVTHDRSEAFSFGDRIAVLFKGGLAQVGSPEEVFAQPATEEIARFVGMETILPGTVLSLDHGLAVVDIGPGKVAVEGDCCTGDRVLVCLRSKDLTLLAAGPAPMSSARNVLEGKVVKAVLSGPHVRVVVDCGVPVVALVTRPASRELELGVGKRVVVAFQSTAAHLIRWQEANAS